MDAGITEFGCDFGKVVLLLANERFGFLKLQLFVILAFVDRARIYGPYAFGKLLAAGARGRRRKSCGAVRCGSHEALLAGQPIEEASGASVKGTIEIVEAELASADQGGAWVELG